MVPVLLLTGFLGSGKTTLLNRLLAARAAGEAAGAGKLAIVVNELGAIGIDGDLLPEGSARQVELPGGCICCALDEDLEKTLLELLAGQPDLSAVVIETTGIAEPAPITWTLSSERLADRVRIAAVITTVDVTEHERHRQLHPSVDAQVDYADLVVLSKTDLASPAEIDAATASVRERNQVAPILGGQAAGLAGELWRALLDPAFERSGVEPPARAGAAGHGFHSVSVPVEDTLDFEELTELLEGLPATYVRIKGIARVVDASTGSTEPRMVAFHRVGARVSAEPARETASGRVVALGTEISADELAACIRGAVISSTDDE